MKPDARPCVVFVSHNDDMDPAPLAEDALEGEAFEALVVRWPDRQAVDDARDRGVAAIVIFGGARQDVLEAFQRGPSPIPFIAIGGAPPTGKNAACWLATPPGPGVLRSLIMTAIPKEARTERVGPAWRRKSDAIIGNSVAVMDLLRMLDRLAPSVAPVLVTGESGSGKDLVARAIHYGGPRAPAPFIAINCAAIPETLFEAELFGHERGAFTGATAARPGAFEAANGGTIFLDEIAEMPLALQAKLLRVLDSGEITRLGSNQRRQTSARVVAATNRDLQREVAEGRFREDLYYRVRVYPVEVPPLRKRPEDIPSIATHHLSIIAKREQRRTPRVTRAALEKILAHSWPGNVRELISTLERAFLMADDDVIGSEHVVIIQSQELPGAITAYREAKVRFDETYYAQLMRTARGNVSLAAKLARKTRKEVYDALKRLNIDAMAYREDEDAPEAPEAPAASPQKKRAPAKNSGRPLAATAVD